jgi:hypothetical protein
MHAFQSLSLSLAKHNSLFAAIAQCYGQLAIERPRKWLKMSDANQIKTMLLFYQS